jgi:flagellar biogenesis protein FliO
MIVIRYKKSSLTRKHPTRGLSQNGSKKKLKILETLSLGCGGSIALVQAENTYLLVGNARRRTNLLTTFSEKIPPISRTETSRPMHREAARKYKTHSLKNLFEVRKKRNPAHAESQDLPDIQRKMRLVREVMEK